MTTADTTARTVLTEADDGREIRLLVRAAVLVRLSSSCAWGELRVDGEAIEAIRVHYESDPGFLEWELRATRPGRAVVDAEGATRDGRQTRRFRLTIVVESSPA